MNGLHVIWYFGRGVEGAMVQASPRAIYWFVSLFADHVRSGPMDVENVMRRCTAGFDGLFHAVTGATSAADMSWMSTMEPSARTNAMLSGISVSFIQKRAPVSPSKTNTIPVSAGMDRGASVSR